MSNNPNAMTKILTAIDNVVNAQHVLEIEIRSLKAAAAELPYSGATAAAAGKPAGAIIHFCEHPGCSYSTLKKHEIEQHQRIHQTGAGGKRVSRRKIQHRRSTRRH